MKLNKILIYLVLLLSVSTSICAQEAKTPTNMGVEELFSLGDKYYKTGKYSQAIAEYEKILSMGKESGNLYYNLAGAYFKEGKLGEAILNYERAKCLLPRDADVTTNYRFAREDIKGRVVAKRGLWSWTPFRIYVSNFTVNELTVITSAIFLVMLLIIFIGVIKPRMIPYRLTIVIILLVAVILNSLIVFHKASYFNSRGVVVVPTAEALFGPFDSATKFFTLQEGMGIRVLKKDEDWYKVRRRDGKIGWVRKGTVQKLWD